jgi:anion-transporting  ArsA/GET3 family ATPase
VSTISVLDAPLLDDDRARLRALIADKRVIVCVGSGGVGKTTTAASIGLAGRRTLVITIDPARRLANALGLDALSHAPQRIDPAVLHDAGAEPKAELSAMMLDVKAAWDDMLFRTAPDRDTAKKILENRFYDSLSRDLPGAHEFIACECLHHLAQNGAWDLLVLDTPPTSNALDFLEAPARILAVLDNEAFRYFANKKQSLGLRFLDGAAGRAQSVLARFAGAEVLEELGEFIVLLRDLYDPLTQRTRDFEALLRGDGTRFCVVTSPQPAAISEARFFLDELARRGLQLGALVVNRVTPSPGHAADALGAVESALEKRGLSAGAAAHLTAILDEAVREQERLAALDNGHIDELVARAQRAQAPLVRVPRLKNAVHDAGGLFAIVPWLAGPSSPSAQAGPGSPSAPAGPAA